MLEQVVHAPVGPNSSVRALDDRQTAEGEDHDRVDGELYVAHYVR
jgi:hypothetical protein